MTGPPRESIIRLLSFVPDGYPTYRADVSTLFGKYLPRRGIFCDLIAQASIPDLNALPAWGGGDAFVCATSTERVTKHLKLLTHVAKNLMRCGGEQYDAIQVRDAVLPALIGLRVARREGIPFFYWMSYPMYESHIERARARGRSMGRARHIAVAIRGYVGKWLFYHFVLPASDHVFVQTPRMLEDVAREGIPQSKMTPVLMGADLEDMDARYIEPAQDPRLSGRRVITYLGTLGRARKIDFLFEVLAIVKRRFPDVLLVLAGDADDPADRKWLEQRAAELGVADELVWTGWLPKQDGWRFVRACEVAVSPIPPSPELDCGSPTKVVEYMALGVPTVGNDQPDQARMMRESGAGLCVPYSAEAFADAIMKLLEAPAEAARMATLGPGYVAAHRSYSVIAEELAEKYSELVNREARVVNRLA
jgi:glycosyltransferase involved in cell wall biosynthesis